MIHQTKFIFALAALLSAAVWGASHSIAVEPVKEASAEDDGWEVLFDGTSTDAFRGFKSEEFPKQGWEIEDDGTLHRMNRSRDIMTRKQYSDFDLRLEWKSYKGANSGIIYRVAQKGNHPHHTGAEYQLIDDPRIHKYSTGALYDLIKPSDKAKLNPTGEWNSSRVVVKDNNVQHYLNGELVVEYVWGSDDIKARIAKSKFRNWPDFMQQETGHIALQSHGKHMWFRDIRIKDLSDEGDE